MGNKLVLDVFGCDTPELLVKGAAEALRALPELELVLPGDCSFLRAELGKYEHDAARVELLSAPDVITNHENPVEAVLRKRESSLVASMERLRRDPDIIGLITAGSTGAAMAAGAAYVGRLPGVAAPVLASPLPTRGEHMAILLDCGANVDCAPEALPLFAVLGAALSVSFCGVEHPRTALLSVGAEDEKGNAFTKAAFPLLRAAPVDFIGNLEARDALSGRCDVLVCDGFSGNVLLKAIEGGALFAVEAVMAAVKKALPADIDRSFLRAALAEAMGRLDLGSLAGAVVLGLRKPIVKAHGNATDRTVPNVARQLLTLSRGGLTERSTELINQLRGER